MTNRTTKFASIVESLVTSSQTARTCKAEEAATGAEEAITTREEVGSVT